MRCIRRMIPSPSLPAFAAFPAAGVAVRRFSLVPGSSIHGRETLQSDASQQENVPKFGTRCLRRWTGSVKSPKRIGCRGFGCVSCGPVGLPLALAPRTSNVLMRL